MKNLAAIAAINEDWEQNPRWRNVRRDYTAEDAYRLRGSIVIEHTLAQLAGFHLLNYGMFELASGYAREGMTAFVRLQEAEFAAEKHGYTATRHQREVGASYFDTVTQINHGGHSSVTALTGSTEEAQFHGHDRPALHAA